MGVGQIITETELLQLQSESKERHMNRFENGETKKRPYKRRKAYKKRSPKMFLPDLMAEMLPQPSPKAPTKPQEAEISIQTPIPIPTLTPDVKPANRPQTVYFAPKQKKEILKWERPFSRVPVLPDEPRKAFTRPPAEYSNLPSFFGIYTELWKEWLKKSG